MENIFFFRKAAFCWRKYYENLNWENNSDCPIIYCCFGCTFQPSCKMTSIELGNISKNQMGGLHMFGGWRETGIRFLTLQSELC